MEIGVSPIEHGLWNPHDQPGSILTGGTWVAPGNAISSGAHQGTAKSAAQLQYLIRFTPACGPGGTGSRLFRTTYKAPGRSIATGAGHSGARAWGRGGTHRTGTDHHRTSSGRQVAKSRRPEGQLPPWWSMARRCDHVLAIWHRARRTPSSAPYVIHLHLARGCAQCGSQFGIPVAPSSPDSSNELVDLVVGGARSN